MLLRFYDVSRYRWRERSDVTEQRDCTVAGRQSTDQLVPATTSQFAGHHRLLPGPVPNARALGASGGAGRCQWATELSVDDCVPQCYLLLPCAERWSTLSTWCWTAPQSTQCRRYFSHFRSFILRLNTTFLVIYTIKQLHPADIFRYVEVGFLGIRIPIAHTSRCTHLHAQQSHKTFRPYLSILMFGDSNSSSVSFVRCVLCFYCSILCCR